jgi:hypothetical protein
VDQVTQVIRILKTPLTLIGLLLLTLGAGYWGLQAAQAPIPKNVAPCVMTDVGKELTPKSVQVRVLNAGGSGGLAKSTANERLRPYGFDVIRINNADGNRVVDRTVVIGHAVDDPEVKLVMQFFPNAIAEGDGRVDHVVDVLVGTAFVPTPSNPVTTVPVDGKVCLPQRTTASTVPSVVPSASPTK